MTENSTPDKHSLLFLGLVTSFQQSALTALGKLVNPLTGKTEIDLSIAAAHIDMLDMLMVKTEGNLTADETKTLEQIISYLKLNYVEEVNKSKEEKAAEKKEPKAESSPTDSETAADQESSDE